jgi:ribulose-phosphate 3-epimerase
MAGLALKPDVPAESIEHVAADLDCIIAMTVNPGFSGQGFIESGCAKISALRRMCKPDIDIYVDGGINPDTVPVAIRYGANVLAVASAVFKADVSPGEAVKRLRGIAGGAARAKD